MPFIFGTMKMTMMRFQLMLAPMERIATAPFRTLCYRNGADLTFSENARVANLARKKRGEMEMICIEDGTPTQIQLSGARLADYEKFLSQFKPQEGFRGFNLNLGCPAPSYIRQGIGAAMVKRVSRTDEIVRLIQKAGHECSIKMRLGENRYEKDKEAYLNLIKNVDALFFAVHARTAEQTMKDPVDFGIYASCKDTGKNIVANGDIRTLGQLIEFKKMGLYGAMIGRAARVDPGIFRLKDRLD